MQDGPGRACVHVPAATLTRCSRSSQPRSPAPAPGGGLDRAGSARGSSNDLPRLEGQPKKKKSKLGAGSAAPAAAAGAGAGGDAEGISQGSDATPPGAGKAAAAGPVAAGFTNPLTSAGAAEPGSAGRAGGSSHKPPLALQRSTGEPPCVAHCGCSHGFRARRPEAAVLFSALAGKAAEQARTVCPSLARRPCPG